MNDTINHVGAGAPADRLREALAGLLAIVDDSRGVAGYHLNGAIADWDEFPEVESARAMLAAAPAQAEQEPVAWMTHHDEPMFFSAEKEAAAYCDNDESPIPLYAAPPAQPDAALVEALEHLRRLRELQAELKALAEVWSVNADEAEESGDQGAAEALRLVSFELRAALAGKGGKP